jgi:hypothetical protein
VTTGYEVKFLSPGFRHDRKLFKWEKELEEEFAEMKKEKQSKYLLLEQPICSVLMNDGVASKSLHNNKQPPLVATRFCSKIA